MALCQLFGEWHLLHDAPVLTRLGSGDLAIDVLQGTCRYNLRWIAPLMMVGRLRSRLREALAGEMRSPASIQRATLDIRLDLSEQLGLRNRETVWRRAAGEFVGCRLNIRCHVETEDGASAASLEVWQEWPREWAER